MFAQALRQWACLFPQRSDVDAAQGQKYDWDGNLPQEPSFIHAGRLEGVLELDPESADGEYPPTEYRFKMLARSRRNAGVFSPAFMQMVAMHQ